MNRSINNMVDTSHHMVADIRGSSNQIATASQQVAQGAQSLSSASTQQSSTIETLSDSVSQIQKQAEENAVLSQTAMKDTNEAGRLMVQSIELMSQMNGAMSELDENSRNISSVIKIIDDIAFQTNILALNAAVEAARAGEYGKGFAVVADEVRSLAQKSAEAASETSTMIEKSVESVKNVSNMANETSESMRAVGELAEKSSSSIQKIDEASQRQTLSINEVNGGIQQLSTVVMSNSATAEELAAASDEMSGQAAELSNTVKRFRLEKEARFDSEIKLPEDRMSL
jgi:methyl-accepting chemotaxis protein